jgi:hypothetical protein
MRLTIDHHEGRKDYLGDGAYVRDDEGWGQVWLTAENGESVTQAVCLDDSGIASLVKFLMGGRHQRLVAHIVNSEKERALRVADSVIAKAAARAEKRNEHG